MHFEYHVNLHNNFGGNYTLSKQYNELVINKLRAMNTIIFPGLVFHSYRKCYNGCQLNILYQYHQYNIYFNILVLFVNKHVAMLGIYGV